MCCSHHLEEVETDIHTHPKMSQWGARVASHPFHAPWISLHLEARAVLVGQLYVDVQVHIYTPSHTTLVARDYICGKQSDSHIRTVSVANCQAPPSYSVGLTHDHAHHSSWIFWSPIGLMINL